MPRGDAFPRERGTEAPTAPGCLLPLRIGGEQGTESSEIQPNVEKRLLRS